MVYDIAILGYGISAMIAALAFAKAGKRVIIIGAKSKNDNRTTALTKHSWEYLANILPTDELQNQSSTINDIYVLNNKASDKMLHFAASYVDELALGYIIPNTEFKAVLSTSIENTKLITILEQNHYEKIENLKEQVIIYFKDGQIVNCKLLVICSGANSPAYKTFFKPYISKNYNQSAITFNVCHAQPHENTAVEHFMPQGPFAILPLRDQHYSSIVWTLSSKLANIYANMNKVEFEHHIQNNFGSFLGKVRLASDINLFPLKAHVTDQYFNNRAVIVADSAHIIHPLAGQGLNQGIKDIKTLVDLVSINLESNKLQLEKYQAFRRDDNLAMYLITDNLNRLFSNDSPILSNLCKFGLWGIEQTTTLKRELIKYACGQR